MDGRKVIAGQREGAKEYGQEAAPQERVPAGAAELRGV